MAPTSPGKMSSCPSPRSRTNPCYRPYAGQLTKKPDRVLATHANEPSLRELTRGDGAGDPTKRLRLPVTQAAAAEAVDASIRDDLRAGEGVECVTAVFESFTKRSTSRLTMATPASRLTC